MRQPRTMMLMLGCGLAGLLLAPSPPPSPSPPFSIDEGCEISPSPQNLRSRPSTRSSPDEGEGSTITPARQDMRVIKNADAVWVLLGMLHELQTPHAIAVLDKVHILALNGGASALSGLTVESLPSYLEEWEKGGREIDYSSLRLLVGRSLSSSA